MAKEHKHVQADKAPKKQEPGTGSRSLQYWQNLAKARSALSGSQKSQAEFEKDPNQFMARFGCEVDIDSGEQTEALELEHLELQMKETCEITLALGPVAVVGAGVKSGAVAVNAVGGANMNGGANGNWWWNGIGPVE